MIKFISISIVGLFLAVSPVKETVRTVVIDAGHGGKDVGASHDQILEKEITSSIAQKLEAMSDEHTRIVLTRTNDNHLSIGDRIALVNEIEPDLLLSLHVNMAQNSSANGLEIYVGKQNQFSAEVGRTAIAISKYWPMSTRVEKEEQTFLLLNDVHCPALMIEMGFLSNPVERDFLTSENGQDEIAKAIFLALKS